MTYHHDEIAFMALTVWREARGQDDECIAGVAHSILNRVFRPSWWGDDILAVIFKKWQYSSTTDPNDKQLTTWPEKKPRISWNKCMRIVEGVLAGEIPNPAPGADSYFDDSISPPYWADRNKFVVKIGRIFFYDLDQDYERQ
jgi:spore germination cell wall hydrolase CwlJ-like protein